MNCLIDEAGICNEECDLFFECETLKCYKKGYEAGYIEGWRDHIKILKDESNYDEYFHFSKSAEPFIFECGERGIGRKEHK